MDLPIPRYISKKMATLIKSMMEPDPAKRPTMTQVMQEAYVKKYLDIIDKKRHVTTALDTMIL